MQHRVDIDGLRAIAVGVVVIFHLGSGLPGGFVGVDIFFVISGYLIASSLYADAATGGVSIVDFYERRARRILPALFATIIASAVAAVLLLYPSELVAFSKSAIAAALFSANIYFYAATDYFAPDAAMVPLLHLWSLGIEEQFYILFPLAVWAFARRVRTLAIILSVAFVASLVASQVATGFNPPAAFYLPQYRAFELLIGCMLALPSVAKPRNALTANGVWIVGAGAITFAVSQFNAGTPFPGFAALLPCLGAAALIWSGPFAPLSRLLQFRSLSYVGRISYSLYLVHWPIWYSASGLFRTPPPSGLRSPLALLHSSLRH